MRIVITGAGIVSALGVGKEATLTALLREQSFVAMPQYLETQHTEYPVGEVPIAGEEGMSRTAQLGRIAAREALLQAGISDVAHVAFINGTTVGGMDYTERHWQERDEYAASIAAQHTAGASTLHIAETLGKFAYTTTVSTACSSALNALIVACEMLLAGEYKQVLAGGAEWMSRFHFNGFRSLQILSTDTCRPFADDRSGLNLGEGAAYLLVETEESALQRGAAILAYIAGYGNACDAFHQTATSPEGEGPYLAMKKALAMAGIQPDEVDYIHAHGTATENNDATEKAAMQRLFNPLPSFSSTKAFTGHATSAAGGIETVICILSMLNGFIPANLPDGHTQHRKLRSVLCNSFGFGGNDSSVLLCCHPIDISYGIKNIQHLVSETFTASADDYRQYLSPMQARRLTPALRQLVAAAYRALKAYHIDMPDAVITATDLGCIHHSVTLLNQLTDEGEDAMNPTPFMQSVHNTPSSLLAMLLRCHGYNCTYSHGSRSLSDALADATRQIRLGRIQNALVLHFEEDDPTWQTIRAYRPYAEAIVLTAHPNTTLC